MMIDLAKAFNLGAGFGIGLLLLPFVFWLILAFGGAQYKDGSYTNTQPDMVEDVSTRPRTPSPAAITTARSSDSADQVKKPRGAAPLGFYFAMFYLPK